jgi:hypothetical protein
MTLVTPVPPDLAAVVVHGPATTSLTPILWDLGFRPVAGTARLDRPCGYPSVRSTRRRRSDRRRPSPQPSGHGQPGTCHRRYRLSAGPPVADRAGWQGGQPRRNPLRQLPRRRRAGPARRHRGSRPAPPRPRGPQPRPPGRLLARSLTVALLRPPDMRVPLWRLDACPVRPGWCRTGVGASRALRFAPRPYGTAQGPPLTRRPRPDVGAPSGSSTPRSTRRDHGGAQPPRSCRHDFPLPARPRR